jgi:two-component system sensor histidine kinase MprB
MGFPALAEGNLPTLPPNAGGPAQYSQVVAADGTVIHTSEVSLPVDASTKTVAAGRTDSSLEDIHVSGSHLRVFTFGVSGGAVQLARPLDGTDHVLSRLRLILALLCVGGIALAALLGRLAARRVIAPLAEVAETARQIGETDDLSHRLKIHADDEVGALARRFNLMLERLEASRGALDESVRAQRQLVADASHELRTPITSLRTNIEVLLAGGRLSEDDRRRLLTDVVEQSEELSLLVGDLIELARGDLHPESVEDARLDRIVAESITRARRNSPAIEFRLEAAPVIVDGVPDRLGRAVNNLLDNAARHSPPGGVVEVTVDLSGIRVRDHGPGVDPKDLPHIFDRFYRGASARGQQGSGLGLAIVRQVAEQHRGSVSVQNAPEGGAIFTLRLPTTSPDGSPGPQALGATGAVGAPGASTAPGAPETPEADPVNVA